MFVENAITAFPIIFTSTGLLSEIITFTNILPLRFIASPWTASNINSVLGIGITL